MHIPRWFVWIQAIFIHNIHRWQFQMCSICIVSQMMTKLCPDCSSNIILIGVHTFRATKMKFVSAYAFFFFINATEINGRWCEMNSFKTFRQFDIRMSIEWEICIYVLQEGSHVFPLRYQAISGGLFSLPHVFIPLLLPNVVTYVFGLPHDKMTRVGAY